MSNVNNKKYPDALPLEKRKIVLYDNIAYAKCLARETLVIAYEFECTVFCLLAWIFNH